MGKTHFGQGGILQVKYEQNKFSVNYQARIDHQIFGLATSIIIHKSLCDTFTFSSAYDEDNFELTLCYHQLPVQLNLGMMSCIVVVQYPRG